MTRDRNFKRLVRARMDRTGESYAAARAALRRRGTPRVLRSTDDHAGWVPATWFDLDLVTRCATPVAQRLRVRDVAARQAALRVLPLEQATLLAFWMVYRSNSDGLTSLCDQLPHRMVDERFWTFVAAGLERIQTPELLTLLRQLRAEVSACLAEQGSAALVGAGPDLDEASLGRIVEGLTFLDADVRQALDAAYARIAPPTLQRVARYVRGHSEAFPWGSGPAGFPSVTAE